MKHIFLLIFLLLSSYARAATFYAFIGADTYSSLKLTCEKDLERMKSAIAKIAKMIDMKLHLTVLSGKEFTPHKLESWIDKLQPHKDDVVLFYISGHGRQGKSRWPLVYFSIKRVHMDFAYIGKKIAKKNTSLALILADVCNGKKNYSSLSLSKLYAKEKKESLTTKGFKTLFRKYSGTIIASSSKPGHEAFGTIYGSYFTNNFLFCLQNEAKLEKPKWKHLFEKVHSLGIRQEQKPQVELELD